jgi:hypothetical protein
MRSLCVALLTLTACCTSFDEPGPAPDVAATPPGPPELAPELATAGAFGAPRPLVALNTSAHERFPVIAADGLSILFARTETSGSFSVNRPYVATRGSVDEPFDPPARAAAFGDTSIHDFELSVDGLEWYYWKGLGQLARSVRASTDEPWSPPEELGFDGFSPSLSADGLSLYYLGLGDAGVIVRYRADRATPWSQPQAILVAGDETPIAIDISSDELALLVTADTRLPGGGVFIARRPTIADDFGPPEPIESLRGAFESARFGNFDQFITVTDARRANRDLAIAAKN